MSTALVKCNNLQFSIVVSNIKYFAYANWKKNPHKCPFYASAYQINFPNWATSLQNSFIKFFFPFSYVGYFVVHNKNMSQYHLKRTTKERKKERKKGRKYEAVFNLLWQIRWLIVLDVTVEDWSLEVNLDCSDGVWWFTEIIKTIHIE